MPEEMTPDDMGQSMPQKEEEMSEVETHMSPPPSSPEPGAMPDDPDVEPHMSPAPPPA